MTERDEALAALVAKVRKISAATSSKAKREALPDDLRHLLAGLEGVLARLDAAEKREAGRD